MIELEAYINDVLCGVLSYDPSTQRWAFTYDAEWLARNDAFPLGPTLPLRPAEDQSPEEQSQAVRIFFENLLPEGRALDDAAATYKVSKSNSIGLLRALGRETAGAIELRAPGSQEALESTRRLVSREDLSERIRERPGVPFTVWDGRVRLSIAGFQDKLAVFEDAGEWYLVDGSKLASTHLLKPEPVERRLAGLTTNERFCMQLGDAVGLPVAPTRLEHVPEPVLVVERFDRRREEDRVRRLHCIDGCQALGLPAAWKVERLYGDGRDVRDIRIGASLPALFAMIDRHAAFPAAVRLALLRWAVFQALIGNVDAHAKNLSFFVGPEGLRLAPAYDLTCGLVYGDHTEHTLALGVGDEFDPQALRAFDWALFASQCALSPRLVARELTTLARGCLDRLSTVHAAVRDEGGDADTLERVCDAVHDLASRALETAPLVPEAFANLD